MSTLYNTRVTAIGGRSEDAYKRATEPKELKGAGHVDLYTGWILSPSTS